MILDLFIHFIKIHLHHLFMLLRDSRRIKIFFNKLSTRFMHLLVLYRPLTQYDVCTETFNQASLFSGNAIWKFLQLVTVLSFVISFLCWKFELKDVGTYAILQCMKKLEAHLKHLTLCSEFVSCILVLAHFHLDVVLLKQITAFYLNPFTIIFCMQYLFLLTLFKRLYSMKDKRY